MASKSNLTKVFENASKNLFDTMRYDWGIGYMEEQMPEKKEIPDRRRGEIEPSKKTRMERLKESIAEAGAEPASIYKAYQDQYKMMLQAGKMAPSFAGSKFRLGVRQPGMAGTSKFSSIKEASASDYRTKNKERMKKFLIERAYTAKA
jgi:hypothetical protein